MTTKWDYRAIFYEDNAPAGIFCVGHDVTELTKISDELQQIKISQSHSIRLHVANLIGLGKLMQEVLDYGGNERYGGDDCSKRYGFR